MVRRAFERAERDLGDRQADDHDDEPSLCGIHADGPKGNDRDLELDDCNINSDEMREAVR